MPDFGAFLRDPRARPRTILLAAPRDASGDPVAIRLADGPFVTGPADDPADAAMAAILKSPPAYSRRAADDLRLRGGMSQEGGEATLLNLGREDWLGDLVWKGAEVQVLHGDERWPIADFRQVYRGVSEALQVGDRESRLVLRSPRLRLDVPVVKEKYGGTGGLDGHAGLKDTWKPVALGALFNVQPVYVGVVGGLHFYQVHDGAIEDVPAARSRGGTLAKVPGVPAGGQYQVDAANGGFYTPAPPDGAMITCDVEGDKTGGVYVSSAAEVYERLVTTRAGFVAGDFLAGTVATLHAKNPAPVGIYVTGGETRVSDEARAVMDTVGALDHFDRDGKVRMLRFEGPAAEAVAEIGEGLVKECERLASVDPASAIRLASRRNWRPLDEGEAGDLADEREAAMTPWLWSEAATGWAGLIDNVVEIETRFRHQADGDAEAARLAALFGAPAKVIRQSLRVRPYERDVGDTVRLVHSRHGLAAGRLGWVLGITETAGGRAADIYVWMEASGG